MPPVADSIPMDSRNLAASLTPELVKACDNQLHNVSWFRTDWQRGGAATATADVIDPDGITRRAVVKLPVVVRELIWTKRLSGQSGDTEPCTPAVYFCGEELGGYDLAWLVLEHLDYGPLALHWTDDCIQRIAEAAASFYVAANHFPVDQAPPAEDWRAEVKVAQKKLADHNIPDKGRWKKALKKFASRLDDFVSEWEARRVDEWIHGDLHPANAMCRADGPKVPVCLIDLAEIRPGHWIEDAIYLERLLWARPERLKSSTMKPVKALATARRRRGLSVDDDYQRLAMIRRALLAGTSIGFLKSEGSPKHLATSLEWLERSLAEI